VLTLVLLSWKVIACSKKIALLDAYTKAAAAYSEAVSNLSRAVGAVLYADELIQRKTHAVLRAGFPYGCADRRIAEIRRNRICRGGNSPHLLLYLFGVVHYRRHGRLI
jgi:hypothetical protein